MSNKGAYKTYRAILHSVNPPLIPYPGVFLTDMTFIEDGNPDYIGKLINFRKRERIFNVISEVQQFQHGVFPFEKEIDEDLITNFYHIPVRTDNEVWHLSIQREPSD